MRLQAPNTSSIVLLTHGHFSVVQVLISIQSMIMNIPDPWFNEPGYESRMHTPKGKEESRNYNHSLRWEDMSRLFSHRWMTHQLLGFKARIKQLPLLCYGCKHNVHGMLFTSD